MRKWISAAAIAAVCGMALPASAGPNLGMKLACKRYGDAWNSGSRGALYSQTTGDFARVFQRMPHNMFASMPRGGSGQVLSSSKGSGSGHVTVSTPHGVMTFVVVGHGFNWRVADIYKAGDDGRTVSLKGYLDASVTAHEFISGLRDGEGTEFYTSTSHKFRKSFDELRPHELKLVRDLIPNVQVIGKPYLVMNGSTASMRVTLAGDRKAHLRLVHEGSWKIDDYSVESPTMTVESFRNSLDSIVAIQQFRQFMVEPRKMHPHSFTREGQLRDTLVRVHELGFLPMHQKPSPMRHCKISADGESVVIDLTDRHVKLQIDRSGPGAAVTKVDITMGNRWADLAHLIALNERARAALAFVGVARPTIPATAAVTEEAAPSEEEESVLVNASAVEVEAPAKAEVPVTPAVAENSQSATSTRVIRQASYSPPQVIYSTPSYRTYKVRRHRCR